MVAKVAAKKQVVNGKYALYLGDCCRILPQLPDESVGLSVFSPPFWSMYTYSDHREDMANSKTYADFFRHFSFLIAELARLTMPGRVVVVHCMDIPTHKRNGEEIGLVDFPGDIIRAFADKGFVYHARCCVWKDPLVAATRTKAIGLAHKQIVKDSAMCRTGIPDYLLAFRKPGDNPKPIQHPKGLTTYHGARQVPQNLDKYFVEMMDTHLMEQNPYESKKDKRSHWIWQQYASPVWFDIRQTRVLPFRQARDRNDERHICPLQLDVIERCLELWSTKGDVVLTPFMGVGSEVYVAVKNGRKGVGVELKPSYFRQAAKNLQSLNRKLSGVMK